MMRRIEDSKEMRLINSRSRPGYTDLRPWRPDNAIVRPVTLEERSLWYLFHLVRNKAKNKLSFAEKSILKFNFKVFQ